MPALHDRAWTLRERLAARLRGLPWWLVAAAGAVSLLSGVVLLIAEGDAVLLRLRLLIGLGFLLSGIDDLGSALTRGRGRILSVVSGLLAVAGGAALCAGAVPDDGLVLIAALVYLSSGMSKVVAVVRAQSETPRVELVFGVLDLALAVLCAFLPAWGVRALTIVLGLRSMIVGVRIVPLACTRLRRAQRDAARPPVVREEDGRGSVPLQGAEPRDAP
ncbi:hypothetical protein [Microbacterium azadirachtae]|uniref:Acid-resistance membrane protein n=1 Tax=Microbacterium azadirachtae TaxID=582680 RepID=A0A0F0L3R7_9MICO|nr:hypothetical protein [Microbacterium azadirachtae]KJL27329.1 hypothetical protein RL72_00501 [Microbacterium azadirachtae]UXW84995.1 hypothetical protein NFX31_12300 [Microbacterium azadirachtae]SDM04775.1 Uncharacterized membrane protein HdeD, DUF308 family [Microbacterium azadirachtae]SEG30343.1 Uncharacterized membrane protein HdeD, DUF308 family [Microbacterium azadirachtae]SEG33234.1 Uncharacterized membrane protein HdeD, DUF308 family [Microbacterium azadirachtae]